MKYLYLVYIEETKVDARSEAEAQVLVDESLTTTRCSATVVMELTHS